jgi:hypothetical protein
VVAPRVQVGAVADESQAGASHGAPDVAVPLLRGPIAFSSLSRSSERARQSPSSGCKVSEDWELIKLPGQRLSKPSDICHTTNMKRSYDRYLVSIEESVDVT